MNLSYGIPGWTTVEKLSLLASYAQKVPANGWIFEVGTFCGRSAFALAANSDSTVKVTCVDGWWFEHGTRFVGQHYKNTFGDHNCYYSYETCQYNLRCFGDRIELIKDRSPYNHPSFNNRKPNLYFIDGDHSGDVVMEELLLYGNNLTEDGVIIVDDFNWPEYQKLTDTVHQYVLQYNLKLEIFEQSGQSGMAVIKQS